ncbi:somatostatin receptor type 2-like protein [Leptotrombidium deliense]|uniref:Somatostatin receptor type 2-like protein n=1 Tax=Leptotrombidium deliense TaxID=299467 RepID=A0A443S3Y2_9ACAR|nr:somatostatin receptor type 2-like protein [Leptotrombidium deliense]
MDYSSTYCVPLGIIIVLNIAILVKVLKLGNFWKQSTNMIQKKHKPIIMIMLIVCAYAFCWFPYQSLFLMEICIKYCPKKLLKQKFPPEYLLFGYTLGYANSCINPIIYSALSVNFRNSCSVVIDKISKSFSSSTKDSPEPNNQTRL